MANAHQPIPAPVELVLPPPEFWSQQLEVLIGPRDSQHRFLVNPDLLTGLTKYFKGALRDAGEHYRFREGLDMRVEITELLEGSGSRDDRDILSVFLWTLFRRRLNFRDLWYDLDRDSLTERELQEESFERLMRLYLIADYFRCDCVLNLTYDKLLDASDVDVDWSLTRIASRAVSLAWGWLPPRHHLKDEIMDQWYGCDAEEFDRVSENLCQEFVDDWLWLVMQREDEDDEEM